MQAPTLIQAIQTRYAGLYFRSRLEARWATFYNSLRVPFEYEKEGFNLWGNSYLPDFWLPEQQAWVEIKGERPSELERFKAGQLATMTGKRVFIFHGSIEVPHADALAFLPVTMRGETHSDEDDGYRWCECKCGKVGIEYNGMGHRICNHGHAPFFSFNTYRLTLAAGLARAARFEHEDRERMDKPW